jgi:hypothetical protein
MLRPAAPVDGKLLLRSEKFFLHIQPELIAGSFPTQVTITGGGTIVS